jgi:hypothetical protein
MSLQMVLQMSIKSIFYLGNSKEIVSALESNDITDEKTERADFSGGIANSFLSFEDFDILLKIIGNQNYKKFSDGFAGLLYGEENKEAEFQAYLLDNDFVKIISNIIDNDINNFSKEWNKQQDKEQTERYNSNRGEYLKRQIISEFCFWVLPSVLMASMPFANNGSLPFFAKVILPVVIFVLSLLLRQFLKDKFGAFRSIKLVKHERINWLEQISRLRNLCSKAISDNKEIVYFWSL